MRLVEHLGSDCGHLQGSAIPAVPLTITVQYSASCLLLCSSLVSRFRDFTTLQVDLSNTSELRKAHVFWTVSIDTPMHWERSLDWIPTSGRGLRKTFICDLNTTRVIITGTIFLNIPAQPSCHRAQPSSPRDSVISTPDRLSAVENSTAVVGSG